MSTTLLGTWRVKCSYCGNVDKVGGGTKQHECTICGKQTKDDKKGFFLLCSKPDCPGEYVTGWVFLTHRCHACADNRNKTLPPKETPKYKKEDKILEDSKSTKTINKGSSKLSIVEPLAQRIAIGLQIPYEQLKLKKVLGKGAFGVVYSAEWLKQMVAVKQFIVSKVLLLDKEETIEMKSICLQEDVIKEAEAWQRLQHESIVSLKGVTKRKGEIMLVMEYMADGSLDDLIRSSASLPREVLLQIALDVAHGLHYLHSQNILHRDLKSANVLLYDHKRRAKISDFGTLRALDKSSKASTVVGTLRFMAPELIKEQPYNAKADVYSFGALMYHMFSRRLLPVLTDDAVALSTITADVQDIALRELIIRCTKQNPSERPTIEECIAILQSLMA